MVPRIFLLSPARCDGRRAGMLMRDESRLALSMRLRGRDGAPLGELFSFMSGLYFRGKLAYARAFASPPGPGLAGALVITPHRGLLPWDQPTRMSTLRAYARVPIDPEDRRYALPLRRAGRALARRAGGACEFVLLGSVATGKYVEILDEALNGRLLFPAEFVGRGDMSRGGLMLRCVSEGRELTYVRAADVARHGPRPPKLSRPAVPEPPDVRSQP